MAFESVNVSSLKSALRHCKSSLEENKLDHIIDKVSDTSVWIASAQFTLKDAITKLRDERYKELTDKLDAYLEAADYIEQYKALEKDNSTLYAQYNRLTSAPTNSITGGSVSSSVASDANIQNQKSVILGQIDLNNAEMETLLSKINQIV